MTGPREVETRTTIGKAVDEFLRVLLQRNASAHTIKAYAGDLEAFVAYVGSRSWKSIDHIVIRGFLSHLYEKELSKTSVARALAAVRSLYRWLAQEGVVEQNPSQAGGHAETAEEIATSSHDRRNELSLSMAECPDGASFPNATRLMFELLYGCGIRNSELVRHQFGRYPVKRRGYLDPWKREERTSMFLSAIR